VAPIGSVRAINPSRTTGQLGKPPRPRAPGDRQRLPP
jgi:hypothetical protein